MVQGTYIIGFSVCVASNNGVLLDVTCPRELSVQKWSLLKSNFQIFQIRNKKNKTEKPFSPRLQEKLTDGEGDS